MTEATYPNAVAVAESEGNGITNVGQAVRDANDKFNQSPAAAGIESPPVTSPPPQAAPAAAGKLEGAPRRNAARLFLRQEICARQPGGHDWNNANTNTDTTQTCRHCGLDRPVQQTLAEAYREPAAAPVTIPAPEPALAGTVTEGKPAQVFEKAKVPREEIAIAMDAARRNGEPVPTPRVLPRQCILPCQFCGFPVEQPAAGLAIISCPDSFACRARLSARNEHAQSQRPRHRTEDELQQLWNNARAEEAASKAAASKSREKWIRYEEMARVDSKRVRTVERLAARFGILLATETGEGDQLELPADIDDEDDEDDDGGDIVGYVPPLSPAESAQVMFGSGTATSPTGLVTPAPQPITAPPPEVTPEPPKKQGRKPKESPATPAEPPSPYLQPGASTEPPGTPPGAPSGDTAEVPKKRGRSRKNPPTVTTPDVPEIPADSGWCMLCNGTGRLDSGEPCQATATDGKMLPNHAFGDRDCEPGEIVESVEPPAAPQFSQAHHAAEKALQQIFEGDPLAKEKSELSMTNIAAVSRPAAATEPVLSNPKLRKERKGTVEEL